jgi:energy-coupling factor transport system substrate-specific component
VTRALDVPFFIDSWATSAGVIAGGLGVGVAGGVLYNLLMAVTIRDSRAWIWMASSALVAWSTWVFRRAGWIDIEGPFRLVAAGMLTGLANACLATAILHFVIGIPDDPNTRAFRAALRAEIGDTRASLLVQEIAIEIADKTISLIGAAALVVLLLERSPSGSAHHA